MVILDLGGPALGPAADVEGDEVAIERGYVEVFVENGGATVDPSKTDGLIVGGDRTLPGPQLAAGAQVERGGSVWAGDVHDSVGDDRRDLVVGRRELVGPLHSEYTNVCGCK